jgi:hypothetical protein
MKSLVEKPVKKLNLPVTYVVILIFLVFNLFIIIGMLFLKISWVSKIALDIIIAILAKDSIGKIYFKSPIASFGMESNKIR